jgi:hypothetical protein
MRVRVRVRVNAKVTARIEVRKRAGIRARTNVGYQIITVNKAAKKEEVKESGRAEQISLHSEVVIIVQGRDQQAVVDKQVEVRQPVVR